MIDFDNVIVSSLMTRDRCIVSCYGIPSCIYQISFKWKKTFRGRRDGHWDRLI